jgi:hypothetical protein
MQVAADYGFGGHTLLRERLLAQGQAFAKAEGLALGVALSEAQRARLAEPILWYVEETVPGPDGNPSTALVPRLYLPEVGRQTLAHWAWGSIEGDRLLWQGREVRNTGVMAAEAVSIEAKRLANEKRSASVGEIRRYGEGGYWRITGDTVQPGGFITAARLKLAVERIDSLSGEFYEDGQERSGVLAEKLGDGFHFQPNRDHLQTEWVQTRKQRGLEQVAVMAVATAVAFYTGGAAASALGFAQGTTGYAIASASIGSMAGSAVSSAINGNFDLNNVLKSGLASGLTAGLTQWAGQALGNNTLLNTQQVGDVLKAGETATDLTDKLIGYTVRAGISASVNQMVYGKQAGSFGQAFVNRFVASGAADAAKFIGDNTGLGKPLGEMGSPRHLLAHAALGCAAAALSGNDCAAGAIGGVSAAALNPLLDHLTSNEDRLLRDAQLAALSTAASGLLAHALGEDIGTAVSAAQNETLNNYLTRSQKTQMLRELEACSALGCKAQVYAKYGVTSSRQDIAFASGVVIGATGRAAQVGVETVEGIGKIAEDIPGTLKALKEFVANLDAGQVKTIGAEAVAEYQRRIDRFEQNYQRGGWQGAQDAGIEFGALVVDGAMLAGGVGAAGRLALKLGGAASGVPAVAARAGEVLQPLEETLAATAMRNQAEINGITWSRAGTAVPLTEANQAQIDAFWGAAVVAGGLVAKEAKGADWTLGRFKSEAKWAGQLEKRGWTKDQITEALNKGERFPAENLVNKGNPATRYVHPETGQSVVIDNITKEVIHVGGPGFRY